METGELYNTQEWADARERVLARDHRRCTVARLLGGTCSGGPLHAHHIVRPEDGGDPYDEDNLASVCARHHPQWEMLRRVFHARLTGEPTLPPCGHKHPYAIGREACMERRVREHRERLLARLTGSAVAA